MSTDLPSSSHDEENKTPTNRVEMVQTARQFLLNPRVRNTSVVEQRKFLSDKGLTETEIDEAFEFLPTIEKTKKFSATTSTPQYVQVSTPGNRIVNALHSAVIVGSASYMAYKLVRSWFLPKFFNIPDPAQEQVEGLQLQLNDLQNSQKFVLDTVMRTLDTVSIQQEQLNRAQLFMSSSSSVKEGDINKLHSDIEIIKSLLLNQNQFPPIPENFERSVANEINSPLTALVKEKPQYMNDTVNQNNNVDEYGRPVL